MGMFEDCCSNITEPYGGNMPLFRGDQTDASVTIVQEKYDGGMSVTKISTPPRTEASSLIQAIDNILGYLDVEDPFSMKDKGDKNGDDVQSSGKKNRSKESRRSGQENSEDRVAEKGGASDTGMGRSETEDTSEGNSWR